MSALEDYNIMNVFRKLGNRLEWPSYNVTGVFSQSYHSVPLNVHFLPQSVIPLDSARALTHPDRLSQHTQTAW